MMVNNMTNIEGSRNDDEFVILLLLPDCYDISFSREKGEIRGGSFLRGPCPYLTLLRLTRGKIFGRYYYHHQHPPLFMFYVPSQS